MILFEVVVAMFSSGAGVSEVVVLIFSLRAGTVFAILFAEVVVAVFPEEVVA